MLKNKKGFIIKLRQSRAFKGMSIYLALQFLFEIVQPTAALALTEGPSQPETQTFEPIGTTQMVDAFSGDFNYNIPLFNLPGPNGGYPVNIAYHAGVTMDDEASWVGLGWNINVGSLTRSMRGLPDEFESKLAKKSNGTEIEDEADPNYDYLEVKADIKEAWTLGARGSLSAEALGADLAKLKSGTDLSINLSVYYNNYNGVGVSAGAGVGKHGGTFSYGLSMDKDNGLGVSANLSRDATYKGMENRHTLGLTFDGSLSVNYSLKKTDNLIHPAIEEVGVTEADMGQRVGETSSFSSGISFARNNFVPSIANKTNDYSLSIGVRGGVEIGVFGYGAVNIFYNTQDLDNDDKKGRKRPVIGYTAAGNNNSDKFTRDFIRSNDGQITQDSKFLAHSQYAYDVYNSSGQGLSGYFRPRRSDIGRSFDPDVTNLNFGASGSFELGAGALAKTGFDVSLSFGYSSVGPWDTHNDVAYDYQNPEPLGIKENVYFQAHGEHTILSKNEMNHIGGFALPEMRLAPKVGDDLVGGKRKVNASSFQVQRSPQRQESKRVVRNTLIHNLKNKEVGKLGEFKVNYFDNENQVLNSSPSHALDRTERGDEGKKVKIGNHPAGFKVLNEEGSYYVYGLPAYNNKEIENLFSVAMPNYNPETYSTVGYDMHDGEVDYKLKESNSGSDNMSNSHKFINKTTKSPYAHSHLLTSVQGADYVDVTNNGPTNDDLGYWVKFNYVKYADKYKWRAPYTNAQYHRGQVFTSEDDKASYQYGEKEVWYLGQMETKSHIAVFKMSKRKDSKESTGEHNDGSSDKSGLKIDEIRIYDKKSFLKDHENAVALQVIHFKYDYSLCKNSPNSDASGKLTLKSLYFTSNGSKRGERNRYNFEYNTSNTSENPSYAPNSYDSWGTYKPLGTNYEHQTQFPYTNQFNQDWSGDVWEPNYTSNFNDAATEKVTKETQDRNASVWCLKAIKLPSGGTIKIDYESDDYGYVQHKTANQMFKIKKMGDGMDDDELYKAGNDNDYFYDGDGATTVDEKRRRIYFKLEKPIPQTTDNVGNVIYDQYVKPIIQDENGERNLYFKTRMRLTHNVYDYVSGYLPLEEYYNDDDIRYGVDRNIIENGHYTYGFVTIKPAVKKLKGADHHPIHFHNYHPMALAGWTHLQTDAQKLLHNPNSLQAEGKYNTPEELLNKLADLLNIIPATASSFGLIRPYCKSKDMARYIDLKHSVIKLASPDKIKFGGGHRVKQISITDNWSSDTGDAEKDRTYGQVYDYTIDEESTGVNGEKSIKTISSGVAQYEPQAGGDENPLKYPIYYLAKASVFTKNNLFAEAPLNEDMFPGASVGYRKVTVKSINTKNQIDKKAANDPADPAVGRTAGVTVQEFYTSKEFPTFVEHSDLSEDNSTLDVFKLPILIPLVGSIKRNYLHGVQAFKIELNDMSGKQKSIQSFEINNYTINSSPITSTFYEYQSEMISYQNESVYKLDNEVNIIDNNGTHAINPVKRTMGVEYDLFTDQRESKTFHQDAGLEFGVDVPPFPTPFPSVWPSFNNHKSLMRTYVSNKVIHRAGILKKTIQNDLQTTNETEIVAYDEKSGTPMVSKIKNEFGDYFYSYNIPAYYHYDRMGHAYQNINYNFSTELVNTPDDHLHDGRLYKFKPTLEQINTLVKGDELITSNMVKHNYQVTTTPRVIPDEGFHDETIYTCTLTSGFDRDNQNIHAYTSIGQSATLIHLSPGDYYYNLLSHRETTINNFNSVEETSNPNSYILHHNIIPYNTAYVLQITYENFLIGGITYMIKVVTYNGVKYYDPQFSFDSHVESVPNGGTITVYDTEDTETSIVDNSVNNYTKCYFLGWERDATGTINGLISFIEPLSNETNTIKFTADLKVVRSGRRNHNSAMVANYLTKGSINNGTLAETTLKTNAGTAIKTRVIESNVLSATASLYKDDWSSNFVNSDNKPNLQQAVDRDINPFLSGNSGIFRPYKSYTYVGARKSSASMHNNTSSNPNLRTDGVFTEPVKMFSWDLGNMEDYVSNWEWVNEVTRFSNDSYEIENVNRLGTYSSALYGYDNSLTLAVGGNSSYYELGTDDFETVPADNDPDGWKSDDRMKQNHFNFYKDHSSKNNVIVSETSNIKKANYVNGILSFRIIHPSNTMVDFLTNSLYSGGNNELDIKSTLGLSLTTEKSPVASKGNESYFLNGSCQSAVYSSGGDFIDVQIKPYAHCYSETTTAMPNNSVLHGKITVYSKRAMQQNDNSSIIKISDKKAHTGKKSMEVKSTVVFDQPMLKAIKDKKYITSVWVSRDKNKVASFRPANGINLVIPGYMTGSNFTAFSGYTITYGKVIEGWQKIDLEFTSTDINPIVAFQFNPGTTSMYVDDIRYSPKTGGIMTYVYDPVKYWLRASLNVDNYATLFFYDEEGNLTIKKQETEKGIFTITESRGHISEPKTEIYPADENGILLDNKIK